MKPTLSDNKFSQVEHGGVPLSLSEYLSRVARFKLVKAIIEALEELQTYEKDYVRKTQLNSKVNTRRGVSTILANELGTTKQTVNRWLNWTEENELPISCNANAEKLLKIGMKYAPEETFIILDEDLENHRFLFEYMIYEVKQGDVPLHKLQKVEHGGVPL